MSATRQEDIWEPEDEGQMKMDRDVRNSNDPSAPKPVARLPVTVLLFRRVLIGASLHQIFDLTYP
jgi:hypothetical protein